MVTAILLGACGEAESAAGEGEGRPNSTAPTAEIVSPTELEVEVVRVLPHDPGAYTQGLLIHDGLVYESRGQYGHSGIDVWDPVSGEIRHSVNLPADLFGEGLTRIGDSLWQLTWQAGVALRWSLELERTGERRFRGEGWGLEHDGQRLLVTDGTHEIRFLDPATFEETGRMSVMRGARPQDSLNELELVAGTGVLWANVYQSDEIVRIDLDSGRVSGVADLSGLLDRGEAARADVLNGIAWWPERESFLVTGKHWPKSFEVRFSEPH